jgi:hypothetical protein
LELPPFFILELSPFLYLRGDNSNIKKGDNSNIKKGDNIRIKFEFEKYLDLLPDIDRIIFCRFRTGPPLYKYVCFLHHLPFLYMTNGSVCVGLRILRPGGLCINYSKKRFQPEK